MSQKYILYFWLDLVRYLIEQKLKFLFDEMGRIDFKIH